MAEIGVTNRVHFRNQFGQFMSEIHAGATQSLINLSVDLEQEARKFAKPAFVTGKMEASIRGEVRGNSAVAIVTAPYWSFVHDGAPPHYIGSAHGPLAQTSKSNTPNDPGFFAPSGQVFHPGTRRPRPFMKKAYDKVWPTAILEVDRNID